MPITDDQVRSVGFVVRRGELTPVGTCFLVSVPSDVVDDFQHGYVVTAEHNIISTDVDIWMTTRDGQLVKELQPTHWATNTGFDVAAAQWTPFDDPGAWIGNSLERQTYEVARIAPRYGGVVLYAGLLAPVESMGSRGQPMVRTATVGFVGAEEVAYGDRVARIAHIIDCRSWRGFSGSPCWLETTGPVAPREGDRLPPTLEALKEDHDWVGKEVSHTALWGMLVGYTLNDHGVGVVTPIEAIKKLVNEDHDLRDAREVTDHLVLEARKR